MESRNHHRYRSYYQHADRTEEAVGWGKLCRMDMWVTARTMEMMALVPFEDEKVDEERTTV